MIELLHAVEPMLPAVAEGGGVVDTFIRFLGRLHPMAVHFPIALILFALVLEGWRLWRPRDIPSGYVRFTLFGGAISAVAAALLGWAGEDAAGDDEYLFIHKWVGFSSAALSIVAYVVARIAKEHERPMKTAIYRIVLLGAVVMVSITGHYGGVLVYGPDHYDVWTEVDVPPPPSEDPEKIDFVKDVKPILEARCVECHCEKKVKGKLRLDLKELAMKKKDVIIPGKSAESTLYTMLIEEDPDERMPPKGKPLTGEQIAIIRDWIDAGAGWPDGVVLTKQE